MKKIVLFISLTFYAVVSLAQQEAVRSLALDDMSAFKTQAGNWRIVGDVTMDPTIDIHPAEQPAAETKNKKKKSKEAQPAPSHPQAVTFAEGKGILLNINDETKKDNLVTNWEHGDIELELEVMLPKGSNSGIYLQGRYEVQLLDSWGVTNPKYSDMGGIYRNWENTPGKIYMGKAPLSNPSKAPGLWQTLRIAFKAPRFDSSGKKIANARFTSVELNGLRIHDNIEVPLPTGGPIENNEKASGPLMIQGDHGPVAFRNIRYKLLRDLDVSLSDLSYKAYQGNFKSFADFALLKPVAEGTMPTLTCEVLPTDNAYGIIYAGNLTVAEDATYEIGMVTSGGLKFVLNNQELINRTRARGRQQVTVALKPGTYPFEIHNFKDAAWMPPRLGFYIKTPATYQVALHAFSSNPPDDDPVAPILINPGSSPKLLRAFIDFKDQRSQRLTHTIGVGDPSGVNYVYDLKAGNLVCVWRGNFADATPMWHDRGDGSFKPRGAIQYLFTSQPLAFLSNEGDGFPATSVENDFKSKGYVLDEKTGRPIFKYIYKGLEVNDKIYPADNDRSLTHEIQVKGTGHQNLYYKLAEGRSILALPNGTYAVDDKQYYIKLKSGANAKIRDVNGKKELVVPVSGQLEYTLIW
jgi:hypothetical protein